ncbi:MAG TPA: non-homologous end-joining DNA ligase [Verrucomicrobiae bacterium]|nr:non-homologous end-joining DNA ligase [Verrucomicrobiae bacterium]
MITKNAPVEVKAGGKKIKLSNPGKLMYPGAGFTKSDVIQYYTTAAPALLPHLRDRLLTLKRYPEGVKKFFFYEKRCPEHRPSWIKTKCVKSKQDKAPLSYCVIDSLAGLIWVANLASLEFHTLLGTVRSVDRPTMMVYDLDPGPEASFRDCAEVAGRLGEFFDGHGLRFFVKTSGKRGLHFLVPLNTPVTFAQTKAFARRLGERFEREDPGLVSTQMRKDKRRGKVFVDWSQNDNHKTTVCVYSLRATEMPSVSMPITWAEVEALRKGADPAAYAFGPQDLAGRLKKHGELFAPVLTMKQKLPRAAFEKGGIHEDET